jgi:dihydropteroate synthase
MGIVNVTPDSFSDGGLYLDPDSAAARGLELVEDGADILDIGGESTRPGSKPVPAEEELRRILPVIKALRAASPVLLSVDTSKPEVAQAALDEGADIINDISAFRLDTRLLKLVAEARAGLVLMHMKGTPRTMQAAPRYQDVVAEVRAFLDERLTVAQAYGVDSEAVILDPGIGFGKRLEGKILATLPQDRLEGTIAASVMALAEGAHILRVHDVKAVKRAARVADAILAGENPDPASERREPGYAQ